MDNEQDKRSIITEVLQSFAIIFTITHLSFLVVGFFVPHYLPKIYKYSSVFALNGAGLSNGTILQIAGLSIFLGFFKVLFLSYQVFLKMRFLPRYFLLFLASLITVSVFSIIFEWFPKDNTKAWIAFVSWFSICFLISAVIIFIKFKILDKKYDRLLKVYKEHSNKARVD